MCSASNALIYGEECANDLNLYQSLFLNKQALLNNNKAWYNEQMKVVLEGDVNRWIPNLMPDIDGYLTAYQDSLFSLFRYYATFAQENNRPIWGMKLPEWNPAALMQTQQLFPDAKIIYIYRELEDCVRSAKRLDMVRGLAEIQQFCAIGQQYLTYAKEHLTGSKVLYINYHI